MKLIKPKNHDEYIAGFPPEVQHMLEQIRNTIRKTVPGAEESIRYGMPAFKIGGEHLYIAAYKKHIGMYPMYGTDGFEVDLSEYRGKGTKDALHFPYKKPIPMELIEKIVLHKIKTNKG